MVKDLLVLDTETTHYNNVQNKEDVVEIAITKVDLEEKQITKVYDEVVGYDLSKKSWGQRFIKSENPRDLPWIFKNSTLSLEELQEAKPVEQVVSEVRDILENNIATSYNVKFDFGKFLRKGPWYLNNDHLKPGTTYYRYKTNGYMSKIKQRTLDFEIAPCIMEEATPVCAIPSNRYGYKYPNLDEAMNILEIEKMEYKISKELYETMGEPDNRHRALFDTVQASLVLLSLHEKGEYDVSKIKQKIRN